MDKIPIIERKDDLKTSDDSEFILKKSAVTTEDSSEADSYFYSDNFEKTSFKAIPIKPRVRDLPFIRPRIGRGGRLHIDRWYPTRRTLSGEDLLQLKSSHTKGDENVTASEVRETLDRVAERWRYDSPEEALSDTRHPLYDDFEPDDDTIYMLAVYQRGAVGARLRQIERGVDSDISSASAEEPLASMRPERA